MTTEPTEPSDDGEVDPMSVEPEELAPTPTAAGRSFPRTLLVTAAVLAVVAIGAGVFALTRGGDDQQKVGTEGAGGQYGSIWNSTWELVALERDGEPWAVEPSGETGPQLTTTNPGPEAISYQACNQGTGQATVEGGRLVMTEFAMTAAACIGDDPDGGVDSTLMDQEVFVTELLSDRPTIEITGPEDDETGDGFDSPGLGDRLVLTTAKGSATFERTAIGRPIDGGTDGDHPQALWGRMWDVTSMMVGGKTTFVAIPLDGSPLRLDASTTGQLSFNGCNGAGGQFDLDEDRLVVVEIGPSTMIGCEQALMDQDDWLRAFLQAEPTVTIFGNHLTLTTDEATIEFEAADVVVGGPIGPEDPEDSDGTVSSPPQPQFGPVDPETSGSSPSQGPVDSDGPTASVPVGDAAGIWSHTWTVVKITDGGQERRLVTPAGGAPLRLEATTADATGATGHASFNGCNGAGGMFDLDGNRLVIAEELSHRQKLCKPDALMDQEEWLWSFLTSGPTVTITGGNLTLATEQATIDLVAS